MEILVRGVGWGGPGRKAVQVDSEGVSSPFEGLPGVAGKLPARTVSRLVEI